MVVLLFLVFQVTNTQETSFVPSTDSVMVKESIEVDITKDDSDQLEITILNTGKSDCIIIQTASRVIMIDTAEKDNYSQIQSVLQEKNINVIDILIITHFDKDHVGGAGDIISNFQVGEIFEPDYVRDSTHVQRYRQAITDKNAKVTTLTDIVALEFDNMVLELQPTFLPLDSSDDNNHSIITSLQTEHESFLFMGDAEVLRLHEFVQTNSQHYDFVKMPHHGRWNMMLESFLTNVQPQYVVITCSNEEPAEDATLKLLERLHISYWLTSDGTVDVLDYLYSS